MQRVDHQGKSTLFQLCFWQIHNSTSYRYINLVMIMFQQVMLLLKIYELIDPNLAASLQLNYSLLLIIVACLLLLFLVFTIISYTLTILTTVWVYALLFVQATAIIPIEIAGRCFSDEQWCQGDPKMQISSVAVILVLTFIIYLRSFLYVPLSDITNPLSMSTGKTALYTYSFTFLLSFISNGLLSSSLSVNEGLVLVLTGSYFAIVADPPWADPLLSRIFSISSIAILWTSFLTWSVPLLQSVLQSSASLSNLWYQLGFSLPVIVGLSILTTTKYNNVYKWQQLFTTTRFSDLNQLYKQVNQLYRYSMGIKRSQLKQNSVEFRKLQELIEYHNNGQCKRVECPLKWLRQNIRVERGNAEAQRKRFNRTMDKIFEFGVMQLANQKDQFPNSVELRLEIAHYELQVFHQRTKGIQLYNKQYHSAEHSGEERWAIFYLKSIIEHFDTSGEQRVGTETEEEISSFKHDIQVSVSQLAEWWYFLSDPKCNIKKLYELANVLFPLKRGVDKAWSHVKRLKSIESYHLYAKYLIKMFNDRQNGMKILDEAHKLEIQYSKREEVVSGQEGRIEESGIIFLEFDGKQSGVMYQVNTACEKIFGYNKGELLGRKVNDIMPRTIAHFHDRILEEYKMTGKAKMMNKERHVWGKSKDGLLFPFTIIIKPVKNQFNQTTQVFAMLRRELWVKESAFFFTDSQFNITDASSSFVGIFPQFYSRLHQKRKLPLIEVLPQWAHQNQRILQTRESLEFSVERSFPLTSQNKFVEVNKYWLNVDDIRIQVAGLIGYVFRISKTSLSGENNVGEEQKNAASQTRNRNLEASSGFWQKRDQSHFKFVSTLEKDQEGQTVMGYYGGAIDDEEAHLLMSSRIHQSFEVSRREANQIVEEHQKINFGEGIRTKRLYGTTVRQIHEMSDFEDNMAFEAQEEEEQEQAQQNIKPNELKTILQRQPSNHLITILKLMTIVLLTLSSIFLVIEFVLIEKDYDHHQEHLAQVSTLTQIQAQIMYLNSHANLYRANLMNHTQQAVFQQEINLLDRLSPAVPSSINSHIKYSDHSDQELILTFGINKLISESQVLLATGSSSTNDPDLFFVQYNSVNGLQVDTGKAIEEKIQSRKEYYDSLRREVVILLVASGTALFVLLVLKNVILQSVLDKKAQIINVFFEIPRKACSDIQKECERFVQHLSSEASEDMQIEMFEEDQFQEEGAMAGNSRQRNRQKKRTIVGEQNTATYFIIISILVLLEMLFYPILVLVLMNVDTPARNFSAEAVPQLIQVQTQFAKFHSHMNTHITSPTFNISEGFPSTVISAQYTAILDMLTTTQKNLFYIGNLYDKTYIDSYNQLFFHSLCQSGSSCDMAHHQEKGLNSIFYCYSDYLVDKYQALANTTALNSTTATQDEQLRVLMKQYWRELSLILQSAAVRQYERREGVLFGVMLAMVVFNMVINMYFWIKFFVEQQQKINATEYILTFIPIEEINKNPAIVKYIRQQVLGIQ